MLGNIRRVVNILLFVLLAPLIGYREACTRIFELDPREGRRYMVLLEKAERGELEKSSSIEASLLHAARHYEMSGLDHTVYFEFLFQRVATWLDDVRRKVSEHYTGLVVGIVGSLLFLLLTFTFMPVSIGLISSMLSCLTITLVLLVHSYQPRLLHFDYLKATPMAVAALLLAYFLSCDITLSLMVASLAFTLVYGRHLARAIHVLTTLRMRVMTPFLELMWSPTPREPSLETMLERELRRLWEVGREVGAPWFIARLNRLVDLLVHTCLSVYKIGIVYSIFLPLVYVVSLVTYRLMLNMFTDIIENTQFLGLAFTDDEGSRLLFTILAVVVSICTGKLAYSIGLGLCLIWILLLPVYIMF